MSRSTPTPERLEWLRAQLADRVAEDVLAGEIFRPRGAWGHRSMRIRRFLFRRFGLGDGLHRLERRMGTLNLAVATPTRLVLFRLSGSWRSMDVAEEIAAWPRRGLGVRYEHRTVGAEHFSPAGGNTFSLSRWTSKILVVRIEPPREAALEIDVAQSRDASALMALL
jgi:hypothetical protein